MKYPIRCIVLRPVKAEGGEFEWEVDIDSVRMGCVPDSLITPIVKGAIDAATEPRKKRTTPPKTRKKSKE